MPTEEGTGTEGTGAGRNMSHRCSGTGTEGTGTGETGTGTGRKIAATGAIGVTGAIEAIEAIEAAGTERETATVTVIVIVTVIVTVSEITTCGATYDPRTRPLVCYSIPSLLQASSLYPRACVRIAERRSAALPLPLQRRVRATTTHG